MDESVETELLTVLQALSEREREARDLLIEARDELQDRDDTFAALEAELWARFEEHERHHLDEVTRLNREAEDLREEIVRLRVRLERILNSAPLRAYGRLRGLPGVRRVVSRRTHEYESAVDSRLHG